MERAKLILEVARRVLKVVEDLRALADSVQGVCTLVTDSLQEEVPESPPEAKAMPEEAEVKALPEVTLEQVRGVLADKSRSGKTAEVRAIIQKFGADKLSGIDPKDYPAILKEAEVL